ncbi:phage major capsid protein [Moorella sp. E306M]|uniref:phage major capsid protein n=1 Tax=Moorella sp. E306M TaxID=2572683 RepID=UPI0010FFB271|nr:phage major capsid protein [Moorella sp. E306M]GEA17506.1 hypothetical protein E306M_06400 [Moorella sp. E306M]
MNLQELRQKLGNLCDQQQAIVDKAVSEGRALTEEEKKQFDNLQAQIDGLNETIKAAEAVQARADKLNEPADKPFRPALDPRIDAGYRQQDKLDDGGFKSLGEFIHAVRFGDPKGRLDNLPRGQGQGGGIEVPDAFKAQIMPWRFKAEWRMDEGASGGFAVPTQFRDDMLMLRPEEAIVRPRATVIPAGDPPDGMITIPAFDQGAKGVFGGVEVYWVGEGEEKPETGAGLREVSLQPHEVAAHTVVTDKLLRNWQAASSFISTLLRSAVVAAEDMAFLRGNGVAKPIGVLNGAGTIAVNRAVAGQITSNDVINMLAKLLPESKQRAVWIANQSALPQIATLQDAAGNYIFIKGDATRGIPDTLLGIPIRFTGKTPALGQKGDLILVDFTYYLIKDGSGPFVAASEHVYFKQNKTVIKVFWNVDGKGWVNEPLTLEDGITKVSPYVVLDVPAA